jgi:hypothetical protein
VDSEKRVNGIGFGEAFAIVIEHGDVGTENECRGWTMCWSSGGGLKMRGVLESQMRYGLEENMWSA